MYDSNRAMKFVILIQSFESNSGLKCTNICFGDLFRGVFIVLCGAGLEDLERRSRAE